MPSTTTPGYFFGCLLMAIFLLLPVVMRVEASTNHRWQHKKASQAQASMARRSANMEAEELLAEGPPSVQSAATKRAPRGGGGGGDSAAVVSNGQPEEIFSLGNHLDSNYDEYPMVVPKRAALLLDRLMVALHHALEKERRRIGDFYQANDKEAFALQQHKQRLSDSADAEQDPEAGLPPSPYASLMYSDDDPSVGMDYDFKDLRDLNAINRATGQTSVSPSLQRRDNGVGVTFGDGGGGSSNRDTIAALGEGLTLLRATPPHSGAAAAAATAAAMGAAASSLIASGGGGAGGGLGGGGVSGVRNNIGRMYWRCYFNAVSCF